MIYDAIDSVLLAAVDPEDACRRYERLGLRPSSGRAFQVGDSGNRFAVELLSPGDPWLSFARELPAPGGLVAVALRVPDLDRAAGELASKGIGSVPLANRDGRRAVWLRLHEQAGADLVLTRQDRSAHERQAGHALPLMRLDHLAVVTHDLEGATRFWADVLGVPVAGEVVTPALVIRQLKIGDAVLELLGPASADSPLWKRPPGLVSMASWQVGDLDSAVAHARSAGFGVTDPAAGVLPGTRVATVGGGELAGVNMQLLQYV